MASIDVTRFPTGAEESRYVSYARSLRSPLISLRRGSSLL
jgi:hypothetical protein